jgi:hypothetical protein
MALDYLFHIKEKISYGLNLSPFPDKYVDLETKKFYKTESTVLFIESIQLGYETRAGLERVPLITVHYLDIYDTEKPRRELPKHIFMETYKCP